MNFKIQTIRITKLILEQFFIFYLQVMNEHLIIKRFFRVRSQRVHTR